jgi:hypothetical protein
MSSLISALLATLSSVCRSRAALQIEILALRHQLGVLHRSARRWLWAWLSQVWSDWRSALVIVKTHATLCLLRLRLKNSWNLEGTMVVIPFYQAPLAERS